MLRVAFRTAISSADGGLAKRKIIIILDRMELRMNPSTIATRLARALAKMKEAAEGGA